MNPIERLDAYCAQREREIESDTCEQALCIDERATLTVYELRMLLGTIATLREATRIRVTEEEPPTDRKVRILTWHIGTRCWIDVTAYAVLDLPHMYTHWAPLPERPVR
jgi:hypothetical protein